MGGGGGGGGGRGEGARLLAELCLGRGLALFSLSGAIWRSLKYFS